MARDRAADERLLGSVLELARGRDIARAAALAEQALAGGLEHPLLLNVLATRLEEQGRIAEAVALLERAVAIAPDDVAARNALALGLQRVDRPAEALQHLDVLLQAHPELGFAHANRGNALIALGSLGRARDSHLRALELEPGNLAATAALASIATHRGEHVEARRWAEQALAAVPGFPDAVLSLAAAELADGALAAAEARLRRMLADKRVAPADQARGHGLLGDVLDAAGRYGEAFGAYRAANELLRRIHARYGEGTSVLAYAQALAAAVAARAPGEWRRPPAAPVAADGAAAHVFLLGFPRSGTTLLEVVLDGHPRVASLEEHELLIDGVLEFMREPLDFGALLGADAPRLERLRAAYWRRAREAGADVTGKVFIDKHPLNTLKLPLIARLFPDAKILFACRDPRDVVLSCFRRRFRMNAAMYGLLTLPGAAALYDAVMSLAAQLRPLLGLDWQVVEHERLVEDFATETAAICGFLGLERTAAMGDFAGRVQAREHATPSTAQLARGLRRDGLGHWRHYAAELAPVRARLDPWAVRLGYPP